MRVAHVNRGKRRLYLELQGYNFTYLFLGIYLGEPGTHADEIYHYTFMDMEGSNEGARPTEVIHD